MSDTPHDLGGETDISTAANAHHTPDSAAIREVCFAQSARHCDVPDADQGRWQLDHHDGPDFRYGTESGRRRHAMDSVCIAFDQCARNGLRQDAGQGAH